MAVGNTYSASNSDASSASASFTAGAKFSGLIMTPSKSTPPFLDNLFGAATPPATEVPVIFKAGAAVLVAVLVAAALLKRRK